MQKFVKGLFSRSRGNSDIGKLFNYFLLITFHIDVSLSSDKKWAKEVVVVNSGKKVK